MKRPRLLAVLPRGEAIRNFVWNDGLAAASDIFDVRLCSVDPSERVWAEMERRYPGVVELTPDPTSREVRWARELLRNAHNESLHNGAARYRVRSHRAGAGSPLAKAKVEAWRLAGLALSSQSNVERLALWERRVSRRRDRSTIAPKVLTEVDPDVVFNTSEVHSANAVSIMQVARWQGVPTATFLFSWDNLTSQRRLLVPADRYLVWSEEIAKDLHRMYPEIGAERVSVTGTPQFDPHFCPTNRWSRAELARQVGLDADRPIVLYTTGMANHMPGEPRLVEEIADRLEAAFGRRGPQLVVRVYAKDRTGRFADTRRRRSDIIFSDPIWEPAWLTPLPEDTPLWTSLLANADVGINVASTVSLELCMFDRPVVNVGFNPPGVPEGPVRYADYYDFDHYRKVVDSGAVSIAESIDDLIVEVRRSLRDPEKRSKHRRALMDQMFGSTLDGLSGTRVGSALTGTLAS